MKISILVPVYNTAPYLPQCLDSIVNQNYANLQVVLVDDGSTDGSEKICDDYAAKYSFVEAHHQPNQGVAVARNHLLSHITGDAFLFVDADDWLEPGTLATLASLMQERGADIVNFGMVVNDAQPQHALAPLQEWDQSMTVHQFLRHTEFNGSLWNKLTRVSLLQGNPSFRPGISYGEDALFTWQLLQHATHLVRTQREFYHYRMNAGSISHQTYGPKKESAYFVWQSICADVRQYWPQFQDTAHARFAIEMTLLLRDAARSRCPLTPQLQAMQQVVRRYSPLISTTQLSSRKMQAYAWLAARSFRAIKLLKNI